MLRYRYTVDPMELEEPARQAPEYQDDIDFGGLAADVRAIVFFDPSAERFESESAMVQELSAAAAAAAQHGVYGFCFFWRTSADTELLSVLLKHTEIPLRYCVCRVFEQAVDPADFLPVLLNCLSDSRYLRAEGKPLLLSLDPQALPEGKHSFDAWRKFAKENGLGELQIWSCRAGSKPKQWERAARGADAEVEFPPFDLPKRRVLEDTINSRKINRPYRYGKLSVYRKVLAHAKMQEVGCFPTKPVLFTAPAS
jgi:hypothetical protein